MNISKKSFGQLPDGTGATLFTLTNDNGVEAKISNYGGTIVSLLVPDKNGTLGDVVLGFDTLDDYRARSPFFGCLVGRYANRIGGAKFALDGIEYAVAVNNGENHLHGGAVGFDKVVWDAEEVHDADEVGLILRYVSVDGEENYPGTLTATVRYRLTNENALHIEYEATTDKATVINLTNHSYFNLAGQGNVMDHTVMLNADRFTPTDEGLIPIGELRSLDGSSLDFRQPTRIGERIDQADDQLVAAGGYDHNWVLNKSVDGALDLAATVTEATSGRRMDVYTTQPGVQFYTGNMMPPELVGKGGQLYHPRGGFCLETQHFPDSPNQPEFPSTVLRPGERYVQRTIFQFSVES